MNSRAYANNHDSSVEGSGRFSGLLPKRVSSEMEFIRHVLGGNKLLRWLLIVACILQFFIFKLFYPFPDFFSDSWSYIDVAAKGQNVNIWPIGYSKFLWLFHLITHSATALNLFQYLFIELAALYFYKTMTYFYPTSRNTRTILCVFLFFNPLNLYLANYISSDGLFAALSLIWFTELLWLLQKPSFRHIIILSSSFVVAFSFRYNALYYPLIAGFVFLICRHRTWFKLFGTLLGPLLVIPIILFVSNAVKELSGTAQFPPILGGWQWANNALYIREYIDEDTTAFPTQEMADLDRVARQYFQQVPAEKRELAPYVGNFFIRKWDAPLKMYMTTHYPKDSSDLLPWAKVAPLFGDYGKYIIKRHPLEYARYFMLMNCRNYFYPPLEKFEVYNLGIDELAVVAVQWFEFDRPLKVVSKDLQKYVLLLLPMIFLLLNMYGAWAFFVFIMKRGWNQAPANFRYTIGVTATFLCINFGFSIFANIGAMRYQIFPMVACLIFVLLLTDYLEVRDREVGAPTGTKNFLEERGTAPEKLETRS